MSGYNVFLTPSGEGRLYGRGESPVRVKLGTAVPSENGGVNIPAGEFELRLRPGFEHSLITPAGEEIAVSAVSPGKGGTTLEFVLAPEKGASAKVEELLKQLL